MYSKRVISLDWLSVTASCYQSLEEYIPFDSKASARPYYLKKTNVVNSVFSFTFQIYTDKKDLATISWKPVSPVIRKDLVYLKLDNQILYTDDWANILMSLVSFFRLENVKLNRMDVCYDCNRFYGNRRVEKFINDYVSVPFQDEKSISRCGSNRFYLIGDKKKQTSITYDYIRFGSPKSDVSAYIYNKTKELLEVADKPYIRKLWDEVGLINTTEIPVYRAEISITGNDLELVQLKTGEIFSITMDRFLNGLYIIDLFYSFANKYLSFKQNNGNKHMKNWHPIILFDSVSKNDYVISYKKRSSIPVRTEKVLVNAITKVIEDTPNLSNAEESALLLSRGILVDRNRYNKLRLKTELEANALRSMMDKEKIEDVYQSRLDAIRQSEKRIQDMLDELELRRELGT